MSQYRLRLVSLASLVSLFSMAIAPISAQADTPLTQAYVQTFRNRVELLWRGGLWRPLRFQDQLGGGDIVRTALSSQVDLRFNEGSFVRAGELSALEFVANTRELHLTQGTLLLTLAPDSGTTRLVTGNAVTQARHTTLVVRHLPENAIPLEETETGEGSVLTVPGATAAGRTAVMMLTDTDDSAAQVSLPDGRSVDLSAGQMAIVDSNNLYIFAFDLALFYETSALVQGLPIILDTASDSDPEAPTTDEPAVQADFAGDYWLDPQFLSPSGGISADQGWLFPTTSETPAPENDAAEATTTDDDAASDIRHNRSTVEIELSPNAAEAMSHSDDVTAPNQTNRENLGVPAGVLTPTDTVPSSVEPPAEPVPLPEDSDR